LINTVISRVHEIRSTENGERSKNDANTNAKLFLEANPTLRIKLPFVTELLSRVDEEDRKDKEAVRGFILEIVDYLGKQSASGRTDGKIIKPKYIKETLQIASYASDPSVSGKALLEYLALLLPQIK